MGVFYLVIRLLTAAWTEKHCRCFFKNGSGFRCKKGSGQRFMKEWKRISAKQLMVKGISGSFLRGSGGREASLSTAAGKDPLDTDRSSPCCWAGAHRRAPHCPSQREILPTKAWKPLQPRSGLNWVSSLRLIYYPWIR